MDPVLGSVLSAVLGGGTIAALLNYLQVKRSQKAGVPAQEEQAIVHATGGKGTTPDWQAFNAYWHGEIATKNAEITTLRQSESQLRASARRRERRLEARIDQLVEYIWTMTGKPAPPPIIDPNEKDEQ